MIEQALAGWERFWFAERETSTLALIRITFGVLMLGWAISLSSNLLTFFGPTGIITVQPKTEAWGILRWFPSESVSTRSFAPPATPRISTVSRARRAASDFASPCSRAKYTSCSCTRIFGYNPRSSGM